MQRLMAGLQAVYGMALGGIRLETALLQGMAVGGKGGVESHGAALWRLQAPWGRFVSWRRAQRSPMHRASDTSA
ncbi:hypothetical protein D3C80_1986230 [compost metagenome]